MVCHKAAALESGDLVESRSCPFLAVQPLVSHFSPLSLSCLQSGVDLKDLKIHRQAPPPPIITTCFSPNLEPNCDLVIDFEAGQSPAPRFFLTISLRG